MLGHRRLTGKLKTDEIVWRGSPVGPSFANAFLSHHEKIWLHDCPIDFKPLFYRRYVDDTFLIFRNADHIPLFLEYLNSKHNNIEFTSETESNNSLSFLDIEITKSSDGFKTSIYRKPTFTGLCTKFTSFIPIQYKRNLVSTLAYRALKICSSYVSIHAEFTYIRNMLYKNGFPYNFSDSYMGKVMSKFLNATQQNKATAVRKTVYLSIPYTGIHGFSLRKNLNQLLSEFYPQVCLRVVFKSANPVSKFFKMKDIIPEDLSSLIVYKYQCVCCNATYVGKCVRHYQTRINEHLGRSPRTGNYLAKPLYSAIREHCETSNHRISKENFSILASSNSHLDLNIMEALYQKKIKPSLGRPSYDLVCF